MAQILRCHEKDVVGDIPPIWRPSAMQANAIDPALSRYAAISGGNGITRLAAPFGSDDMSAATSLSDYVARCTLYFALPEVQAALLRGTCIFEINGTPLFLSSTSDATVLGGSGWKLYRTAKPADLSVGGAWQTAMNALVNLAMNTLAIPAPRNPTSGLVEIGRPGMIFQFMNEPNNEVFWGYDGYATFQHYLLAYHRFCVGARAANADFAVCGPVAAGALSTRSDRLYATSSADVLPGGRSVGGTEGTGRFLANALRSYWTFNSADLVDSAIGSAIFYTTNGAPTGTISSDTFSFRPYNTNGQGNPGSDSDATAHTRCGSGTAYVTGDTTWRTSGAKGITLGATAATDMRSSIAGGGLYTLAVTMAGEGSGGDRYANPLGYNDATRSSRPNIVVQYTKTLVELFFDYVAANSLELDVVDVHNFQDNPTDLVASGAALIASGLASAGLSADLPIIITEFQNDAAVSGIRDDYRTAAYFLGSLHAHRAAGVDAMCMATLLKLGTAPSDPNLFTNEWGHITNGTVNGYYVNTPQFMVMQLFGLWAGGQEITANPSQIAAQGIRQFCARSADSVVVALSRWNEGASAVDVEVHADLLPLHRVSAVNIYRFNATNNDPTAVFAATSGSYATKAAAAQAASLAAVSTSPVSRIAALTLGAIDAAIVEFEVTEYGMSETFADVEMTEVDLFNQSLASVGDYRIDLEDAVTVDSATATKPIVVTSLAHGYDDRDLILALNWSEMTELNRRVFRIRVIDANTYSIENEDGREYTAETIGGETYRLSTGEQIETTFRVWRSIRREVLEEHSWNEATRYTRLARLGAEKTITAITQATQARVTSTAHGIANGDQVLIEGVVGMVELNGRYFTAANATANTFDLAGEDSTGYTAYASGGTAQKAQTPLRPDFGYDYRYTLPADCIRVLTLAEEGSEDAQWEVVRGELFTDEGPTVPIRYTGLLRDPAAFGSKLFAALAARLAHELAPKLTDSTSREERAERRWENQLDRAKRTDGQEQGHTAIVDTSWVRDRY